jgi:peptidoglycan-associated lipoprotein
MKPRLPFISCAFALSLIVFSGACRKKAPVASVPPPPQTVASVPEQPAAPTSRPVPAATPPRVSTPTPAPVEAKPAPPAQSLSERLGREVQDVYFDFDKYHLREDAIVTLTSDARALEMILIDFPNTTVVVEGHCDERGSAEYNLGLGDRRASAVKEYLEQLGIPVRRLITVSYGKERPQCTEQTEVCWQKNRRVHFVPGETQRSAGTDPEN